MPFIPYFLNKALLSIFSIFVFISFLSSISHATDPSTVTVIKRHEVSYQALNPLRGDKSPKAGVLWGNLRQDLPTGMLIKFKDGFSSPPHIHNITYRGVVLNGLIHNDDPKAEKMWMETGSYWTQPAGERHITAAKGEDTIAFLEILEGPYLVKPAKEAFDNGERPINITPQNIIWLNKNTFNRSDSKPQTKNDTPNIAYLWGGPKANEQNGSFIKIPQNTSSKIKSYSPWFHTVIIQGHIEYKEAANHQKHSLQAGSYIGSKTPQEYQFSCKSQKDCILYISTKGKYDF